MKKIGLIAILYLFTHFSTFSLNVGVKSGVINTKHLYNSQKKYDNSFLLGLYAKQSLLCYGMIIEGNYVKKALVNPHITLKNHYLYIPTMLQVYLPLGIGIDFGYQVGYLLASFENNIRNDKNISAIDHGFIVGMNKKLWNRLSLSLKYYYSFTHISKTNPSYTYRNWDISLHYSLFKLL